MDQPLTSIPALLSQRAASHGGETILRTKDRGIWKAVTWSQLDARVRADRRRRCWPPVSAAATWWRSCRKPGRRRFMPISRSWAAARPASRSTPTRTRTASAIMLSSSGSRLAFVENEEQLDKVLTRARPLPGAVADRRVRHEGTARFHRCRLHQPGQLHRRRRRRPTGPPRSGRSRRTSPRSSSFRAATAWPGRTLTHGDLVHMVSAARARLAVAAERRAAGGAAAVRHHRAGLGPVSGAGNRLHQQLSGRPRHRRSRTCSELQPTVLGADAAAWDHLHALATARAKAATATQRLAYDWALRAGRAGGPTGPLGRSSGAAGGAAGIRAEQAAARLCRRDAGRARRRWTGRAASASRSSGSMNPRWAPARWMNATRPCCRTPTPDVRNDMHSKEKRHDEVPACRRRR